MVRQEAVMAYFKEAYYLVIHMGDTEENQETLSRDSRFQTKI
jgi:hypothetical protein